VFTLLPCIRVSLPRINTNLMESALNERQQTLAAIACLEAKGDLENLATAIDRGLESGVTVSAISKRRCRNFTPILDSLAVLTALAHFKR
jgi:hypothetical protein